MAKTRFFSHVLSGAALATLLIAAPVTIQSDEQTGATALKASAAVAKDGQSGGSGGGGSGRDGGDDSGDDSDNDGDSSGRGRGRGSDDDDRRDDDDDHGRRGAHHVGPNGEKIEIEGNKIEVTYKDGYKEEIENGRYELKDPSGRTVVERRATKADIARLRALAS